MNPTTIDQGISWFRAFIQNADVLSIALALGISWGVTQWAKFPIHRWVKDATLHAWLTRTVCTAVAAPVTYFNWPNAWAISWALFIGFASPWIFHWGVRLIAWKFPGVKDAVSAPKVPNAPPAQ